MNLSHFLGILWAINEAIDSGDPAHFTFDDFYSAANSRRVLELLKSRNPQGMLGSMDYTLKESGMIFQFEEALYKAGLALEGREGRKAGVENNPWCVAVAVILGAIENNFPMGPPPKDRPVAS